MLLNVRFCQIASAAAARGLIALLCLALPLAAGAVGLPYGQDGDSAWQMDTVRTQNWRAPAAPIADGLTPIAAVHPMPAAITGIAEVADDRGPAIDWPGSEATTAIDHAPVPLPGALWLFGSGLLSLAAIAQFRRRSRGGQRPPRSLPAYSPARPATALSQNGRALRQRLREEAATNPHRPVSLFWSQPADPISRPARNAPRGRRREVPEERVALRFDQLRQVMLEQPGVDVGRRFGRTCLRFRGKAFLACDMAALAFRVGTGNAERLLRSLPNSDFWNPRQAVRPKLSWLSHPPGDTEALVTLSAVAYEYAVASALDVQPEDERRDRAAAELGLELVESE